MVRLQRQPRKGARDYHIRLIQRRVSAHILCEKRHIVASSPALNAVGPCNSFLWSNSLPEFREAVMMHPCSAAPGLSSRPPRKSSSMERIIAACTLTLVLLAGCRAPRSNGEEGSETAPEGLSVFTSGELEGLRDPVGFERWVKPILENKCLSCHSTKEAPSAYRLENRHFAMLPGPAGARIVPGRPAASRLLQVAAAHEGVMAMPPVGVRLTESERLVLWRWIEQGAFWPEGNAGRLTVRFGELHPVSGPPGR